MASQYLSTKTSTLESQAPVDPAKAAAAQIPLQSFSIPTFPPEAFSAGLEALILTSDIKLDEYADLLTQSFEIPELPGSIKALTLELFGLGFPPGFLTKLGERLRALRSLTVYSQLFTGTTPSSLTDAISFLASQTALKELRLIDVFAPHGVFTQLLSALGNEIRVMEISYTFRHGDKGFLGSLPAREIVELLKGRKGLVGLTLRLSAPGSAGDGEDGTSTEEGIRPVSGFGGHVVSNVVGEELMVLDLTMFELGVKDLGRLLGKCEGVRNLSVCVGLENGWGQVLNAVGVEGGKGIEALEVVGVPGMELVERLKGGEELVIEEGELKAMGVRCKGLRTLTVSILRTKVEHWVREGENWARKT